MRKDRFLSLIFLLILGFPLLFGLFGLDGNFRLVENRKLSSMPKLGLYNGFQEGFQKYFGDNFGGRDFLISLNRNIRVSFLKSSPNEEVLIGKDNWLYYVSGDGYLDTINAKPFSESDLEGISGHLEEADSYFQQKGIKFYLLVAPNKQTVYPEYLPDFVKKVRTDSNLNQIADFLKRKSSNVKLIDPTQSLARNQKVYGVSFHKYDTHWNEFGGFLAYAELLQNINTDFPNLIAKQTKDFDITYRDSPDKDLEILLGVDSWIEKEPVFIDKNKKSIDLTEPCLEPYKQCAEVIKEVRDEGLPRLLMFRDSFGVALIPFLSEHFSRAYYSWIVLPYSLDLVEKEKPDIVVVELTERELWRLNDPLFRLPEN